MLTLEKIMSELKVNSVNEIVGGKHGKTRTSKKDNEKRHRTHHHRHHHTHGHHHG